MKFDLSSLTPRSELTAMFTRMKTLTIVADGVRFAGVAEINDIGGAVVIEVSQPPVVPTVTPLDGDLPVKAQKGRKSK